ncbi:MAG: ABC transporter substrate-binding protein [Acidobacteriota bacterium]
MRVGLGLLASLCATIAVGEELLVMQGEPGRFGGRLVVTQRSEPKTFNPVLAQDNASRNIIRRMTADLVHINRETHRTEPSLAKAWEVSDDGRQYTLYLRRGIRFSDGHEIEAEDVLFSFEVYLDEQLHSPQRDLLIVGGEPIRVRRVGSHTIVFELAESYGAAERIFDSLAILPRHVLEEPYRAGKFADMWSLASAPEEIVGLGPFRLKQYVPGERVVLERNPYYWKTDARGRRLPYLNEIVFLTVPSEDAQVMRFLSGQSHLISRMSADNYAVLEAGQTRGGYQMRDLGPGLEYNFLFFNLNDRDETEFPRLAKKQSWFRDVSFRRAVSTAIDRGGIVRLVYENRATPLFSHVTPGNKLWVNDESIRRDEYAPSKAREILRKAGFAWNQDGALQDSTGQQVEFTIITTAGNRQRTKMAAIVQEDLGKVGMQVQVVTLEFRALIDRVFQSRDYEACVLALGSGDVDPTSEMSVWLSTGASHLWRLGQQEPASAWEAEIDRQMRRQMISTDPSQRKEAYDRVQEIVSEKLPIICLASPNILVGADRRLGNFRPAILAHYTLWNVEQLFFRR